MSYNGTEYVVTSVTLTDVAAACDTQTIDVTLTQGGTNIGDGSGAADADGEASVTVTDTPAEDIDDIHIVIHS